MMKQCPACGCELTMLVAAFLLVDYDGSISPLQGRVEAFCAEEDCQQRFWWHPQTGRITRRNTGLIWPSRGQNFTGIVE